LTLRAYIGFAGALFAPACSSLGGIELHEGAEGRFTAGEDEEPSTVDDGGVGSTGRDDGEGDTGHADDHGPLEPPRGTDESSDGGTDDHDTASDESDTGTDTDAGDGGPAPTDDSGTDDDGTSGDDPQTNGVETASGTTGDTDACPDCPPPCDDGWQDLCGSPCEVAPSIDGGACAGEDGTLVSCDMGILTCAI
jgi:hypothetical protein